MSAVKPARNSVRATFLPFSLPMIGEEEIAEVVDSLRSGWLTAGPKVERLEEEFARYVGAGHAIAVQSCTAALEVALAALGVGAGDEVIVPTMTFCATANVVVHLGARPVLVDVDDHLQISVEGVEGALSPRTKAILPVHYAGEACNLKEILDLAERKGVAVVEDAAHAVGAEYQGRKIGTHGRAVAFSFYATKNMTTGEGGMITTGDAGLARRMRLLSQHGMSRDAWKRSAAARNWYYEVLAPGYKCNMTDIQAALGIHQLRRLEAFLERRRQIARRYGLALGPLSELRLPAGRADRTHSYHLYPVRLTEGRLAIDRDRFLEELRKANIGAGVHFIPLHRHPFYRERYGCSQEQFPVAERNFRGLFSLPLYAGMADRDVDDVIEAVERIVRAHRVCRGRWEPKYRGSANHVATAR